MKAIETVQLTKTYRSGRKALDEFNLTVECGEIFSLLGTNGVGKTTLIKILTTFLKPTSGKAFIMGTDVETASALVRSQVACVAQDVSIDNHLTLHENMVFQGRLYGLKKDELHKREQSLFELFELEEYRSEKAASCSGGIKRRLDIAMSMLSEPKILFLDEPTIGMDIGSRNIMWSILERMKKELGITIFLTTHYLDEADQLSDTICFINHGKKILQGSPQTLRQYLHKNLIRITTKTEKAATSLESYLSRNNYVQRSYCKGSSIYLQVSEKEAAFQEIGGLTLKDTNCIGIEIIEPTLEDIFLEIVEKGGVYGNI